MSLYHLRAHDPSVTLVVRSPSIIPTVMPHFTVVLSTKTNLPRGNVVVPQVVAWLGMRSCSSAQVYFQNSVQALVQLSWRRPPFWADEAPLK